MGESWVSFDGIRGSKYPWFKPAAERTTESNGVLPQVAQCYPSGSLNHRDIAWTSPPDLLLLPGVETIPNGRFCYHALDIESGKLLRFEGCAKSYHTGFTAKMFECISSK